VKIVKQMKKVLPKDENFQL